MAILACCGRMLNERHANVIQIVGGIIIAGTTPGRLRVLMMPDYRKDNPYQSLLAQALQARQVEVLFPVGYRRVLPIVRAVRDNWPIDVLHLHWSESYTRGRWGFSRIVYWMRLLFDLFLVRATGVKIVWTLHNILPHECTAPRAERLFRQRLIRGVSHVIAHGRQSRDDAVALLGCPVNIVSIVPHGNYRDFYPPTTPELRLASRDPLPDDHRIFLFFGFMRPYKGIERLLRVWQELKPVTASLWLAGPCLDIDYENKLRTLAAGISNVRLECGFVAREAVAGLFAAADVVVLPFEQVLTSGSVILALSYGKPVIAPRIGEVPEAVGDADDFLYNSSVYDELSMVIRRALTTSLVDVRQRSQMAGDRLNWDSIAAATAAIYSDATAKPMP